ncbi:ribonuclease VapC [Nakamurella sp. UYEF19]|uniref:type II toxin-antitoxin system VapC family toxin n=1 Tax=Nakamurella sp. UYEF19 TaxID=1756392 RepID=UPI0033945750
MILDASAIVAVVRLEPEGRSFESAIERARTNGLSAATLLETALVLGPALDLTLDRFIAMARITVEPVTEAQARLARTAYRRYGRGSGHPARLNFGDCFSYALAVDKREPLLFKGNDFSQTDVLVAP